MRILDFIHACNLLDLILSLVQTLMRIHNEPCLTSYVLEIFGEDLEELSSDKIYSSGNRGVKKVQDLGKRGKGNSSCHPYAGA